MGTHLRTVKHGEGGDTDPIFTKCRFENCFVTRCHKTSLTPRSHLYIWAIIYFFLKKENSHQSCLQVWVDKRCFPCTVSIKQRLVATKKVYQSVNTTFLASLLKLLKLKTCNSAIALWESNQPSTSLFPLPGACQNVKISWLQIVLIKMRSCFGSSF